MKDRRKNAWTDRQMEKKTESKKDKRQASKQTDGRTDRQREMYIFRWMNKQTS